MTGKLHYLFIAITIFATIIIAVAEFLLQERWLFVAPTLILGFVISLIITAEVLRCSVEKFYKMLQKLQKLKFENKFEKMIGHIEQVYESKNIFFIGEFDILFDKQLRPLEEAARGLIHIELPKELRDIPIRLMDSVKESLDATVIWADNPITDYRETPYLNSMRKAIDEQHVTIRRLFIISKNIINDVDFQNRIKEEHKMKVRVRYLYENEWDNGQNKEKGPLDFGVWDKETVWVFSNNKGTPANERSADILNTKNDSQVYSELFSANWNKANEFEQDTQ